MKPTIYVKAILGLTALSALGVVACSGAESDGLGETKASMTSIRLEAQGSVLQIVDSEYKGRYPNTQKLSSMEVSLNKKGTIDARCFKDVVGEVGCEEYPFFRAVRRDKGQMTVNVYDFHGKVMSSTTLPDDQGGIPDDDIDASAHRDAGGGGPIGDTVDGGPKGQDAGKVADAGSGSSDAGPPGPSGDGVCSPGEKAKSRIDFCNLVNEEIKKSDPTETRLLDCDTLDDNSGTLPAIPIPPPDAGKSCLAIWHPAIGGQYGDCQSFMMQWWDRARWDLSHKGVCTTDPLVLDLDGNGVQTTNITQGVAFDLLGQGAVNTAWIDSNDGFLALDFNGNGAIDDGSELFGNGTNGREYADGFHALKDLDANGDGMIDAKDAAFSELVVWRDRNHDGVSTKDELQPLTQLKITRIFLSAVERSKASSIDANGNGFPFESGFQRADGTTSQMVDVFLRFQR